MQSAEALANFSFFCLQNLIEMLVHALLGTVSHIEEAALKVATLENIRPVLEIIKDVSGIYRIQGYLSSS